ncbi:hypothetical protein [Gulosibacter bifidus]|uniref:Uncharacterized protein n=1 Tax=Gulosibacter bifidus TaxID=272239 RepID=A0ABW5RFK0_9MICO|nr:hypothetical protein [Gulosibacter bifidus]
MLDGGRYTADNTKSGTDRQETNGNFTEDLLNWAEEQIGAAQERGDVVIGMTHWGINEHFSYQPTFLSPYLIDNYESVQQRLANAGMDYIFTGHMHANDISVINADGPNRLVDIETGSLVTYPSPSRKVNIARSIEEPNVAPQQTATTAAGTATTTMSITSQFGEIPGLSFTDNLTEYGMGATAFDPSFLRNVVPGLIEPYAKQVRDAGGIVPFLNQNWTEGLGLQTMLSGFLPAAANAASFDAFKTDVLVPTIAELIDANKDKIPGGGALGTINSGAAVAIVDELLATVDKVLQPGENGVTPLSQLVGDVAVNLADMVITDDGHKLIDLATYGYQTHLRGDEDPAQRPAWVNEVYAKLDSGELVTELVSHVIDNSYDTLIRPLTGYVDTAKLTNIDGYKTGLFGGTTKEVNPDLPPLLKIGSLAGPIISGKLFEYNAEKNYRIWKPELSNLGGVLDLLQNGIDVPIMGMVQFDVKQKVTELLRGLVLGGAAAPAAGGEAAAAGTEPAASQLAAAEPVPDAAPTAGLLTPDLVQTASTMLRSLLDSLTTDENGTADGTASFTTTDQVMRAVAPADTTAPGTGETGASTPGATAGAPGADNTVANAAADGKGGNGLAATGADTDLVTTGILAALALFGGALLLRSRSAQQEHVE